MSKRVLWAILAAGVVALLVVGCAGRATVPPVEETQPDAAEQPAALPGADATPMGESAASGDWTITVRGVEREQSAGGADAASGNELLIIKYDLTNGGPADQGTGPVDYSLMDSAGKPFSAAQTGDPAFIFNIPQPIKKGETREIRIAYEVPAGAGPFVWTFAPFGAGAPAVLEVK